MMVYPDDIGENFEHTVGTTKFNNLRKDVVFVAIKNGKHNGVGYLIDTLETGERAARIGVRKVASLCGLFRDPRPSY